MFITLLPDLHLAAAAFHVWRPGTAFTIAYEFSKEQKAWKCWTLDRGLHSLFAKDGESSSSGSHGESRFSLPSSSDRDAFQDLVFQHSSHVLASWQPALWKGICAAVWTRSFHIPSLLCAALWTQYAEVGVHTDQHLSHISSGASFSFYSEVTSVWPELSQPGRFCKPWG